MLVHAGEAAFDVEAIVFDKDGTLVTLESYWLEPSRAWVSMAAAGSPDLAALLQDELGVDGDGMAPDGPLATASLADLVARTVRLLVTAGLPPAEAAARAAAARRRATEMSAGLPLEPIGDVARAFQVLAEAGLRLAIATTDDHAPTARALRQLGVDHLVDVVVAADGDLPPKPHPEVLTSIAAELGIATASVLMVGDSARDAETAHAAGASGFVLVSPLGGRPAIRADAVIASVEELRPGGEESRL